MQSLLGIINHLEKYEGPTLGKLSRSKAVETLKWSQKASLPSELCSPKSILQKIYTKFSRKKIDLTIFFPGKKHY